MNLIQIVPGLLPKFDGIGDYAMQIARRLRERHKITTSFIVGDPEWVGGPVEGFYATKVASRTSQGLLDAIAECERVIQAESVPLLLHFSPYGYQKRGYPLWLQRALEQWPASRQATLNTVFHELEVHSSRPWSSAFWVSPLQRNLISHISTLGNFRYTNAEFYRHDLEEWGSGRMALIPNFSTVGEPDTIPPFEQRGRDVVVFGRGAQRRANYQRGSDVLASLCRLIGAERIIDIGEPIADHTVSNIEGFPIVRCGVIKVEEVNQWMAKSVASFITYPVPLLPKSSVYAVSCAHGTIPFIFDNQKKEVSCPGLVPGEDYIALSRSASRQTLPPLDVLSATVFNNYQARSSGAAAAKIAHAIFG
ncbi:MAG: hypothetical protein JWM43_884 [Acidobacteriaceae bacterium]|nr:hypothetical protein [Acidobacteriaceae bacterium]